MKEVSVALVAGLFGLVPVILQWITARAQQKDVSSRLKSLLTELEFLERMSALQGQAGARDESAQPQTKVRIENAVSDLLNQYSMLPKGVPTTPTVPSASSEVGDGQPSLFRRIFLLYMPDTPLGWVWHSLFYVVMLMFLATFIESASSGTIPGWLIVYGIILGPPALILQRLARRQEARPDTPGSRETVQSEVPDAS